MKEFNVRFFIQYASNIEAGGISRVERVWASSEEAARKAVKNEYEDFHSDLLKEGTMVVCSVDALNVS